MRFNLKRSLKAVQLWLHHHYKQIRHGLLVLLGVILLIFSMVSIANQNRLIKDNAKLTQAAKQLGEDNKRLNTQSKNLATQIKAQSDEQIRLLCTLVNLAPIDRVTTEQRRICGEALERIGPALSNRSQPARPSNPPASSGSQPAPQPRASQPNNPSRQQPTPNTPSELDNDGVIIDLPLLPQIHIGSPL